jgi:BlaI family penicillinase repressor
MKFKISDAEWFVMRAIWERGESGETITSAEIIARAQDGDGYNPKTVKTYLRRLVAKGFVGYTVDPNDSRVYLYSAKVSEEDCVKRENADFVSLYYKGNVVKMLARFIGDGKFSREQLEELRAILDAKEEDAL